MQVLDIDIFVAVLCRYLSPELGIDSHLGINQTQSMPFPP